MGQISIEVLSQSFVSFSSIDQVSSIEEINSWMAPIQQYVGLGTLPLDSKEVAKVRLCVVRCLVGNELYRQSFMGPYLKCLTTEQATTLLQEIHEGVYENHSE